MKIPKYVAHILSEPLKHPACVVNIACQAEILIKRHNAHVIVLWHNRKAVQEYKRVKRTLIKENNIIGRWQRSVAGRKHISLNYSVNIMTDIVAAMSGLKTTRFDINSTLVGLEAAYQLTHTNDLKLILKYFECVTTETKSDALDSVAYIRNVTFNCRQEILAYRLANTQCGT